MVDCAPTNLVPSVVILLHNSTLNCLLDFIAKLMDDVGEKVMYSEIWPKVFLVYQYLSGPNNFNRNFYWELTS